MNNRCSAAATQPEDMAKSREWTAQLLASATALPISFEYAGASVTGIPATWNPTSRRRQIDANICETVFEGRDPKTGLSLRVECTEYSDYPVVEWVAWFTNTGSEATPVLSNIRAIDAAFTGASPVLQHQTGDSCSAENLTPSKSQLQTGAPLTFTPNDGRPCDGQMPYYRIGFDGGGITLAVGWPGQWSATFEAIGDGVHIHAGQEQTHLRLEPGERIRTPRITLMSWASDTTHAINLWRRWYLAYLLPRPNGQPLKPMIAMVGTDEGVEFTGATEANQTKYIEKAKRLGIDFDVWWLDAGWYPCWDEEQQEKDWHVTGTWEPDPERFPNGLKPVGDCVARHGADFLLWFEPERVRPGTWLYTERPQWLLRREGVANVILNLAIPECRQWLTDHVCKLIQESNVRVYRQDFNCELLRFWRENEGPDRDGMNENLHVQGYLQYWDDLLARNPGLWIDSCSSGGRRNDLETMRRSVPLHYTDYGYGDHPVKLAFQRTMYEWIPYFKDSSLAWPEEGEQPRFDIEVDAFAYHCGMAPMFMPLCDLRRDDYDYPLAVKMTKVWRRTADLILYGDYYAHTPDQRTHDIWVARQFDCPETGRGLLHGFRLAHCEQESLTVHPEGICADSLYAFENPETGEKKEISGAELVSDGFIFELPKRTAALWLYRRMAGVKS
jgi:alpha-galactosidase